LAISSRFCHMMGGTLSVESQLGRGSTFTVRLPAEAPAAETVAASPVALLEHVEHHV
jgi:signal transduction histidine kinase